MEVKVMVVPGKIARVEMAEGTVLDACMKAAEQFPGVDWVGLAKDREVRVQNRKFSNTAEVQEGIYGSIHTTALSDGDVVLLLTKIKGNASDAVITCEVSYGECWGEFALETPAPASTVLAEAAGIDLNDVDYIYINGEETELSRLVGGGDRVEVFFTEPEKPELDYDEEIEVTVTINNCTVTGRPQDIGRILGIG